MCFDLVASPDTANVFYAIGNGGVFKTLNGGVTWSAANAGINRRVFAIEHSQTAPDRLYAHGSRKLFFSNNGATSWQDRTPPAALLTANDTIVSMDASPVVPGRIYAGLSNGAVLRSDDAGITWSATTPVPASVPFQPGLLVTDPVLADGLLLPPLTGFGSLIIGCFAAPMPVRPGSRYPAPPVAHGKIRLCRTLNMPMHPASCGRLIPMA